MLLKVLELMEVLHLQILKLSLRLPYYFLFLFCIVRCCKSLYSYYSKRLHLYQYNFICNIAYEGKVTKYHIFALRHVLEFNCSLKPKNELNSYR